MRLVCLLLLLYAYSPQTFNNGFNSYSNLPTEPLSFDTPLPTCTYTIRKDSLDGEILRFARVGDLVVHRWQCDSGTSSSSF